MQAKQIVTAEDGTKYEIQEDGTLRELHRDRQPSSMIAGYENRGARPLTWHEQRDLSRAVQATEEVPEELSRLSSHLSTNTRAAVRFIEKESTYGPISIPGHRPLWTETSLRPQPAVRRVRPRVQHRGVPLTPAVVWGNDDRHPYNDPRYPWSLVCYIENGLGFGSGVLIGPRHVLTASHIIDWNTGAASVQVHRAGSTVLATAKAVTTWAFTRVVDNDSTTLDEDYAVIVLDQRLGDRFGWMGVHTYDSAWDGEDYWRSIGYSEDTGATFPLYQRDQNLDEDEWDFGEARAMTTSADIMKGQSGSPIFGFWGDDPVPRVVAVVAAFGAVWASGIENWCSGGSLLTRLISEVRSKEP